MTSRNAGRSGGRYKRRRWRGEWVMVAINASTTFCARLIADLVWRILGPHL